MAGDSLLLALGFSRATERTYQQVVGQSGRELVSVAESLLTTPDVLLRDLTPLMDRGVITVEDGRVYVATPAEAVARALQATAEMAGRAEEQLAEIARAIPYLTATNVKPVEGAHIEVAPLDGEISRGGNPVPLLTSLIRQSRGDLLWLRPDQFRRPREDAMAFVVGECIREGRASRAIYPARALTEARDTLELRASVGEQIRILPDLPTRMFIIGTTHAILPEPLGYLDEPRSLTRQRGLVEALILWFECLWEKAVPFDSGESGEQLRPDLRQFLLQQLAAGAQDEQIARRLGVSLRTVRRRVAELMADLGAESRFQAGVESARRGWI